MSKRFSKYMFDSDSSASDSGSKICTRNQLTRFNISSDTDSGGKLNFDENNTSTDS